MKNLSRHCPNAEEFLSSLPDDIAEDIKTAMCESAHEDGYGNDIANCFDRERINACNVRASVDVTWEGRTYSAIVRSGDMNGFVIEEWEEEGQTVLPDPVEPPSYDVMPLAYRPGMVEQEPMRAKRLYTSWKAFRENRPDFYSIGPKYTYDRRFSPGNATEHYWREKARSFKAVIAEKGVVEAAFAELERHAVGKSLSPNA